MSLLWPDCWHGALMPGHSWLVRRGLPIADADTAPTAGPDELLGALRTMFGACLPQRHRRGRLDLVVSDSIGLTQVLPWQAHLTAADELRSYAQACFERQGVTIDEQWIMHAVFRRHGEPGIAYALPKYWMQQLVAISDEHGLKLGTVLPLSAAAYWRQRQAVGKENDLLLLCEPRRISALRYEAGRFAGLDVEPAPGDGAVSAARLLNRVASDGQLVNRVHLWGGAENWIKPIAPDVVVFVLNRAAWS